MQLFPTYTRHEDARCFHCHQLLDDDPRDTGYPPKSGQYSQQCHVCGMHTYYDIVPPTEADREDTK